MAELKRYLVTLPGGITHDVVGDLGFIEYLNETHEDTGFSTDGNEEKIYCLTCVEELGELNDDNIDKQIIEHPSKCLVRGRTK